ncbi:MAG: site-2 protease family protein [Negativicutes bacterium]|jgi:Zn-dependent protease
MFDFFNQDTIFVILALLIALTVHEYAHARVAVYFGDPTPRLQGRLSLNPLVHIDPLGLIVMVLAKFGWAKPVMFDPRYFRNVRKGIFWVSLAGALVNLAVGFLALIVFRVLILFTDNDFALQLTRYVFIYNIYFALFNLIPVPPLDGSKVVMMLLPYKAMRQYERIEPYGFWILMALIFLGVIGKIIMPLFYLISGIMQSIVGLFF